MPTFLIEIPHSGNLTECKQVIKLFVEFGISFAFQCRLGM